MKSKRINQINAALRDNATINFYRSLDIWSNNWRNRYFKFISRYTDQDGKEDVREYNLSVTGNFTYAAAMKEFSLITGDKTGSYSDNNRKIEFYISHQDGKQLYFRVYFSRDLDGITYTCETNFAPMVPDNGKKLPVRSSSTWEDFNGQKYMTDTVIKRHLYPDGIFGNIQIVTNCSKNEAKEYYRKYLSVTVKHEEEDSVWTIKRALERRLSKKLNLVTQDFFSNQKLSYILKTNKRQKVKSKLFKEPNIFELSEQYMEQYDTEDHMGEFLNDIYNDYPNRSVFA